MLPVLHLTQCLDRPAQALKPELTRLRNKSGPISPCSNGATKMPSGPRAKSRARFVCASTAAARRSSPSSARMSKAADAVDPRPYDRQHPPHPACARYVLARGWGRGQVRPPRARDLGYRSRAYLMGGPPVGTPPTVMSEIVSLTSGYLVEFAHPVVVARAPTI